MDKATKWALAQDRKEATTEERTRKRKELQNYNQFYYMSKVKKERRLAALKKRYNLSLEDFDFIIKEQDGVCGICKCHEPRAGWVVDHCHSTGAIRGILCAGCNWLLGHARDNQDTLKNAAKYLEYHLIIPVLSRRSSE